MVKMLALSVFIGNMIGPSYTTVSVPSKPVPQAHTPSDKFAIGGVYQTVSTTINEETGVPETGYGTGFFVDFEGKRVFVTAGHNCEGKTDVAVSREDDLYAAEIVHNGEPDVDLCLLKVSERLKPSQVYRLASAPFKEKTELVSYGYAHAVRLVKLWHKVIEYTTIPQVNNKPMMIMRDATYRGCSGGPVINAATNNVAGVIVMTNRDYALATPTVEIAKAIRGLKKGQWR